MKIRSILAAITVTVIMGVMPAHAKVSPYDLIENPPTYTAMKVPPFNTSFKAWMDYRTVTNTASNQYKFIRKWGWSDAEGFMRCNGERDLGITDDYYLVAMGSFYGTEIGTKYRVRTDMGKTFYVALGDCKNDIHTNATNQYSWNYNVIEFIVDRRKLNKNVLISGSANVYMPLNGSIVSIEKITF